MAALVLNALRHLRFYHRAARHPPWEDLFEVIVSWIWLTSALRPQTTWVDRPILPLRVLQNLLDK